MAQVQTFHVEAGATFLEELTYKDDSGELFDLTGYSARLQLREELDSPAAIDLDLNIDLVTSRLIIELSADDTANLTAPRYKYGLELYAPDGTVTRLLHGSFKVSPEVVR